MKHFKRWTIIFIILFSFIATTVQAKTTIYRNCYTNAGYSDTCSNSMSKTDPYSGWYMYSKVTHSTYAPNTHDLKLNTVQISNSQTPPSSGDNGKGPYYKAAYYQINGTTYQLFSTIKYYTEFSSATYSVYKTDYDGQINTNVITNGADISYCGYGACEEYEQATQLKAY